MTRMLEKATVTANGRRRAMRPKGWTPERRARQSALIRGWQPWRRSTGPRTDASKARCAANPLRHGFRSRAYVLKTRRVRNAIRLCALTVAAIRIRMRYSEVLGLSPATPGGHVPPERIVVGGDPPSTPLSSAIAVPAGEAL